MITGDDDLDAAVAVQYRQTGSTAWNDSLPMLRLDGDVVNRDYEPFVTGDLFAGSILLQWQSSSNRTYSVQTSTDLLDQAPWIAITNLTATPPANIHTTAVEQIHRSTFALPDGLYGSLTTPVRQPAEKRTTRINRGIKVFKSTPCVSRDC